MPNEIAICHFLFLVVQMMQSLCRAGSMAWVFSCWMFLLLLSDPWPAGRSGFQAGWHCWRPCRALPTFGSLLYSKVKNQIEAGQFQTREFMRKVSLSFFPSTPLQWDAVQIKVTDIRYPCPLLIKAHEMISIEKDFELACFLQSRFF